MSADHDTGGTAQRIHPKTATSEHVQQLRERPCTGAELGATRSVTFNAAQREIIARISSPGRGSARSGDASKGLASAKTIYYLWGDDRRAVRRFIEVNRDYCEAAMAVDSASIFATAWDDALYSLFVEEWQFVQQERGQAGDGS